MQSASQCLSRLDHSPFSRDRRLNSISSFLIFEICHTDKQCSSSSLPVAFPVPAYRRVHRVGHDQLCQCAVVSAAVVFQPCSMACVLVQVLRRNAVVLAVVAVDFGVVHVINVVAHVQRIPVGRFVG
jgi:hypothetical protein